MPFQSNPFSQRIISKALEDEDFRARLVAAPRTAIEQLLGRELPADLEIQVLQETPGQLFLVLPETASGDGTVSDRELDVTGGYVTDQCTNKCHNTVCR